MPFQLEKTLPSGVVADFWVITDFSFSLTDAYATASLYVNEDAYNNGLDPVDRQSFHWAKDEGPYTNDVILPMVEAIENIIQGVAEFAPATKIADQVRAIKLGPVGVKPVEEGAM